MILEEHTIRTPNPCLGEYVSTWRDHSSKARRIMQTFLTLICSFGKHLFLQNLFFLCQPLILLYSWEPLSAPLLTGRSLLYLCTGRINFLVSASSQTYTREERGITDTLPGVVYDHVISPDSHLSQMQHPYTGAKRPASTAASPLGVS